jgi:hypothetical protein
MPLSHRPAPRLVVVLVTVAAGLLATVTTSTGAPVDRRDEGPRSPVGEAATGDREAMLAVVQDVVDCLRARGFDPGDPEVQGKNVVIADWDPVWDSPGGRADRECSFPVR